MDYKVYTAKTYTGKFVLNIVIDGFHCQTVNELYMKLYLLDLIDDGKEFKRKIKTLRFSLEFDMNNPREYIESLLIMGKLTS